MRRNDQRPLNVVIFGAGGLGREVLLVLRAMARSGHPVHPRAFIVDPGWAVTETVHGLPLSDDLSVLRENPDWRVVVALGAPCCRRAAVERITPAAGSCFTSAIHPAATIGDPVAIGEGTMILGPCSITTDVTIGRHVLLNPLVAVSHDCRLADYATLSPAVALAGAVEIDEGAELGSGATVIPRQHVGSWSVVGAGATVIRRVPPNAVMVGTPARQIELRAPGWHNQSSGPRPAACQK